MIGSDSQALTDKVLPILKAMSAHVFVMGGLGAGHAMKTLNNYVGAGALVMLCDALVVGQKFGLDPEAILNVLNVGTGQNFSSRYSLIEDVRPGPVQINSQPEIY
jgi:3-hydroxyisobutyrate dehydrogenase-like beta-hydroxyacid dehydrogenase